MLADSGRVSQDAFTRDRAPTWHHEYPDPTIPQRTVSLASRYPPERQSSYQEATARAIIPAPYVQPRIDGHSPRSSSLQVDNTVPISIPNKPDRHNKSSGYGESYNDVGSVHNASFGRGMSVSRHGNRGTQDPSVAARDISRWYDEDEFRDFLEWQEYKKLKKMADAEGLPRRRRRLSGDSSSGDSPATRLSRMTPDSLQDSSAASKDPATSTRHRSGYGAESRSQNALKYDLTTAKISSSGRFANTDQESRRPRSQRERSYYDGDQREKKRHPEPEAPYITSNSSRRRERGYSPESLEPAAAAKASSRHSKRIPQEGTTVSQKVRAYAPKEPARSTRRMREVEEDSTSGDEVRDRDSSPDSIIGHRRGTQDRNHRSDDEPLENARDTRVRMSGNSTKERHRDMEPDSDRSY